MSPMGLLDGEIAEIVGTALVDAGLSLPAILIKVTPGVRDVDHPTVGTAPGHTSYQCAGFVASLDDGIIPGTVIGDVTRTVKIYGTTLPPAIAPAPGDLIMIEGTTTTVAGGLSAVTRDPAGAIYTCQTL